jgi:hypothetical protein
MTTFISLAVSATMFPENGNIHMEPLAPSEVQNILATESVVSALNPSHATTIDVIRRRFEIDLPIPERAPKVLLGYGDSVVILQAQLPRLSEGEVHTDETVFKAPISFRRWTVVE